jgi:hypothetical protein
MAKNLGREFATMSEDERRRFALEEEAGDPASETELDFEEPRDEDKMGRHYPSPNEEEEHQRAAREQATRGKSAEDKEPTKTRTDDV